MRHRADHPIWGLLREEGRYNLVWLAARTGYSHAHVKKIAVGMLPASPRFRAACAALLVRDERDLFWDHGASDGSAPVTGASDDRAGVAACA